MLREVRRTPYHLLILILLKNKIMGSPIKNDIDLKDRILIGSEMIQLVNDFLGGEDPVIYDKRDFKFRLPRGYIRHINTIKDGLHFISEDVFKSNLAYTLQLTDLFTWILNRTDISLSLQSLLYKYSVVVYGNIADDLIKGYHKQLGFKGQGKLDKLITEGIIPARRKKRLKKLSDLRNNVHLLKLTEKEYAMYDGNIYNYASETVGMLLIDLEKHSNSLV